MTMSLPACSSLGIERADSGVGSEVSSGSGGGGGGGSAALRLAAGARARRQRQLESQQEGVNGSAGERCQDCNLWMDKGSAR